MEFKGTKGEWIHTGLEIRHKNTSLIIANVYKHLPINQPIEEANAKLMCASPQMLEALIEVQEFLGHIQGRVGENAFDEIYEIVEDSINKALK